MIVTTLRRCADDSLCKCCNCELYCEKNCVGVLKMPPLTCPFCGADNKPMGAIMRTANCWKWKHWYNGCVLSGFVIKADKIKAWNRRAENA